MSRNVDRDESRNNGRRSLFSIPPPLKRIFDRFPLTVYQANELPIALRPSGHVLYVFAARPDAPSFNPTCLKWQTFLRIRGVPFTTKLSNNHASPSGALPFLVSQAGPVISTKGLRKWITKEAGIAGSADVGDVRYEAYSSLLDGRIRIAWLYQLYLMEANAPVMRKLYVEPASSNPLVQLAIQQQLCEAANAEIRKARGTLLDTELLREAREALTALSSLLADKEWFFEDNVTLFDAGVFAYTHLLLDIQWEDNPLGIMLHENLIRHRDRILKAYF